MSERNINSKRESRELEASTTSVSPLKKKTKLLDDSSSDSRDVVVLAIPSPSAASTQGRCSVTSDEDDKSSIVSSDCFSGESNETVRNNPTSGVDLEDTVSEALGETTETTSSSSAVKRDEPPTAEEIEAFLSELEGDDDTQKRFIEKYNFDIVNDKPLQGRYMWDRLNP